MQILERQLEHGRWATIVVFDACRRLSDQQLDRDFDIGHGSIRATLFHLIDAAERWVALALHEELPQRDSVPSIDQLERWFDRVWEQFSGFARDIVAERREDQTVLDQWQMPQALGAIVPQVILHGEEHRSEIIHMLRRMPIDPVPEIDLALWDLWRRKTLQLPEAYGRFHTQ